jgi:hypothetical protein
MKKSKNPGVDKKSTKTESRRLVTVIIDAKTLQKSLNTVMPFVGNDSGKCYLQSVRVTYRAEKDLTKALYLVATDGHALCRVREPVDSRGYAGDADISVTVPVAAIDSMIFALQNQVGPVEVTIDKEARISLACEGISIDVKAHPVGFYPDWECVMPNGGGSLTHFGSPAGLSSSLLTRCLRALGNRPIQIKHDIDEYSTRPVLLNAVEDDSVVVVMMPMLTRGQQ